MIGFASLKQPILKLFYECKMVGFFVSNYRDSPNLQSVPENNSTNKF